MGGTSLDQGSNAAVTGALYKTKASAPLNGDRSVEIPLNPINGWPERGIAGNSHLLQGISQLSQHSIQKCPTAPGPSQDLETHSELRDIVEMCSLSVWDAYRFLFQKWDAPMYYTGTKACALDHILSKHKTLISIKTTERGLQVFVAPLNQTESGSWAIFVQRLFSVAQFKL